MDDREELEAMGLRETFVEHRLDVAGDQTIPGGGLSVTFRGSSGQEMATVTLESGTTVWVSVPPHGRTYFAPRGDRIATVDRAVRAVVRRE